MSCEISNINAYSSNGIKGLLSDKEGYAIHPIIYQGQKYFIELEWRLIYDPVFREYVRDHDRRLKRGAPLYGRPGGVAACIYSYQERYNIISGHKGEKLFETNLTQLTLGGEEHICLFQIDQGTLKIHLPEIMQIIFNRWEYIKQSPSETVAEIRAAGSRLGWGREPLDEAELGVLRMQAAVHATESWDGVVRASAEKQREADSPQAIDGSACIILPMAFHKLFNGVTCEEDAFRLVSAFVRTYEASRDEFWRKAETTLLTALCLQVYWFDGKENCKQELEGYLKDLQTSDREKRTARADAIFATWKCQPKTAPMYYNIFLQLPPKTQTKVIEGVQSLFVMEVNDEEKRRGGAMN